MSIAKHLVVLGLVLVGSPFVARAQPPGAEAPAVPVGGTVGDTTPSVRVGHSINEAVPAGDRVPKAVDGPPVLAGQVNDTEAQGVAGGAEVVHHDPSKAFNFVGGLPFSYKNQDQYGGALGDGKQVNAHGVTEEEEPMSPPFILMVVNFIILLGILAKFGGPAARNLASTRSDQIRDALEESARLRQAAADKLAEYQAKLAAADAEILDMVGKMRADAEADKARIVANAEAQAKALARDAELRIAAEIDRARLELRRQVSVAATAAAEKLLRDRVNAADQTRLVDAFITDLQSQGLAQGGKPRAGQENV